MLLNDKNAPTIEDIEYICRATFSMLKIPVYFVQEDAEILFEFSNNDLHNPLFGLNNPLYGLNNPLCENNKLRLFEFLESINQGNSPNAISAISTKYLENFVFLKVFKNDIFFGTIIVGPSIPLEVNNNDINLLIKNLNIAIKYKDSLSSYYKKMTIINHESLMNAMFILNYSFTNQKVGIESITEKNDIIKDIKA
jgi:hypothetical protein